jgi:MFS family permease
MRGWFVTTTTARRAVMTTFLVHAAVFATWAPRVPALRDRMGLSHDQLGIALGGLAVGMLVGTRLTGPAERAQRTGRSMRIGVPLLAETLVGPAYANSLATLTLALFGFGVVGGYLDVVMNAHAVAVERLAGRPMMAGFHGMWSIGAMVGSAITATVAGANVGVRSQFVVTAVVLAAVSAPVLRGVLSHDLERQSHEPHPEDKRGSRLVVAPLAAIVLVAIMGFGTFMVEGAVSDWSAVLLLDERGATPATAALGLTVFTGAMAASRLAGNHLGQRVGPVRLARAGAIAAVAGFVVVAVVPSTITALVGFAIMGLGVGPVVPTVFSAAGNTARTRGGSVLAPTVTAGYLGGVLGPIVIGFLADEISLPVALAIPVAFLLLVVWRADLLRTASGPSSGDQPPVFRG